MQYSNFGTQDRPQPARPTRSSANSPAKTSDSPAKTMPASRHKKHRFIDFDDDDDGHLQQALVLAWHSSTTNKDSKMQRYHQSSTGYAAARILALISLLVSDPTVVAGWIALRAPSSSLRRGHCPAIQRGGKQFTKNGMLRNQHNHDIMRSFRRTKTNTTTPSTSTTAIRLGLEDIVFNAENAGFSLANTVLNPPTSASTTGSSVSILFSSMESIKSLLILYAAGFVTSFSPCSLGLLPITISYISNAANERNDKNTILPTLSYAIGLTVVFTTLGVSASVLGGVFGSTGGGESGGDSLIPYMLATISPLVSVLMGLQLLELIRIPLPSLDFKWRNAVMFESRGIATASGGGGTKNTGSLFDENGGLLLGNLQSNNNIRETSNINGNDDRCTDPSESTDEVAALIRMFLLGGTSALVASPCATPVLASLLAYLASVSSSSENVQSLGTVWNGASWMLSYTLGYSTLLLVAGATGGQALVNLRKVRDNGTTGAIWQWITPLTGGVLIAFGVNGLLVALLGDPSLSALAPILE